MKLRDFLDLVTLGVLWGAGYLFIRVAVPEFGTIALTELRMVLAAIVLLPILVLRRQLPEVLANWRPIALMGVVHYAIPFCLFAWAMLTLSAGYTSVISAAAPLFAAAVARLWLGERMDANRLSGLVLGLAGVVLLVWHKLADVGVHDAPAVAAAVLGAFCYGFAAVMAKRKLAGVSPMAVAGGSMSAAALVLLPLSIWLWPEATPSATGWGFAAALGVLCTALAFVLYFRLIRSAGPSKAITVTFVIPLFAVAFGAVFIGEQVTAPMVAGGIVIAIGTMLATGLVTPGTLWRRGQAFVLRSLVVATATVVAAPEDPLREVQAAEIDTLIYSAGIEVVSEVDPEVVDHFREITGHEMVSVRLRRALADSQVLGIDYLAYDNALHQGELTLGWYRSFKSPVSLKILAGKSLGSDPVATAQIELSWSLR